MIKKIFALCLALMLLCSAALADMLAADTVVVTVGERQFTARDIDTRAYLLYSQSQAEKYPDYDAAVESLIQEAVLEDYLKNNGYTDFNEEEEAAFRNEAQVTWDGYLDNYVTYYLTEDTDEAKAALRQQAEQFFTSQGATLDAVIEELRMQAAVEKLQADLLDGYVPTEEEITEVFNTYGAQYKAQYENNVGLYEFATQYNGYESWYVPEGYRSVLHILLEVDDELLTAYKDAQAELEEAQSDESVDEAAVTAAQEKVQETFNAVLASRQDVIDEIYARLDKGESFQDLIAEYGTDPGMKDETNLKEGYKVHAQSMIYDPAFTAGAFQERMQQPGDVSDPVVGSYGIHILYYLGDVPGGMIMTDSIHDEIAEALSSRKVNDAYIRVFTAWKDTMEIHQDDGLLAQLKAEAEAQLAEAEKAQQEAQQAEEAPEAPESTETVETVENAENTDAEQQNNP